MSINWSNINKITNTPPLKVPCYTLTDTVPIVRLSLDEFPLADKYIETNFPLPELLVENDLYISGGAVLWALRRAQQDYTGPLILKDWDVFCAEPGKTQHWAEQLGRKRHTTSAFTSRKNSLHVPVAGFAPIDYVLEVAGQPSAVIARYGIDVCQVYYRAGEFWGTPEALTGIRTHTATCSRSITGYRANKIKRKGFRLIEPESRIPTDADANWPASYEAFRFGRTSYTSWEKFQSTLPPVSAFRSPVIW